MPRVCQVAVKGCWCVRDVRLPGCFLGVGLLLAVGLLPAGRVNCG